MAQRSTTVSKDARRAQAREAWLAALDTSIARGIADADAGRVKSIPEVFDDLASRLAAEAKAARQ